MDESADQVIKRFREQISDTDRALVEAINSRMRLVGRLKRYKESHGIEFVDPEREQWIVQDLMRANRGPLSPEGLREIYAEIFNLTKREVSRAQEADPAEGS